MENNNEIVELFQNRMKEYRLYKELSQKEMSQSLGVSDSQYSRLEHFKQPPTADLLFNLHKVFKVSIDRMLDSTIPISAIELSSININENTSAADYRKKIEALEDTVEYYEGLLLKVGRK